MMSSYSIIGWEFFRKNRILSLVFLGALGMAVLFIFRDDQPTTTSDLESRQGRQAPSIPASSDRKKRPSVGNSKRSPHESFLSRFENNDPSLSIEDIWRNASNLKKESLPRFLSIALGADISGTLRSSLISTAVASVASAEPISDVVGILEANLPKGALKNRSIVSAFQKSNDRVPALLETRGRLSDGEEQKEALNGISLRISSSRSLADLDIVPDRVPADCIPNIITALGSRIAQEDPSQKVSALEATLHLIDKFELPASETNDQTAKFLANASNSIPAAAWQKWIELPDSSKQLDNSRFVEDHIIKNLAAANPALAAESIISRSDIDSDTPRKLALISNAWIAIDRVAAEDWWLSSQSKLSIEARNSTARTFSEFYLKKGEKDESERWAARISESDPPE